MDKSTTAGGQPPNALEWLASYEPGIIHPQAWAAVREFVWDCVRRLGYDSESSSAWRVVRELVRISSWAVAQGLPLDVEVVLDPDTVERFIAVGLAEDPSRATYRAVLRRVGPQLTRMAPWEPRPDSMSRRQVAPPYAAAEIDRLRADAAMQLTRGRVRAARALLAFGAGAGLDGRWVAAVAATDITANGGVVLVRVSDPNARVVPVLREWETEVLDLAATAGTEFLVGGRSAARNRAGALTASLVVANGHPRFSASRLRSTWLVTHLAMGTRLPELSRAAGLQGVTVLSDLLEYVPVLAETDATAMLRGVR